MVDRQRHFDSSTILVKGDAHLTEEERLAFDRFEASHGYRPVYRVGLIGHVDNRKTTLTATLVWLQRQGPQKARPMTARPCVNIPIGS